MSITSSNSIALKNRFDPLLINTGNNKDNDLNGMDVDPSQRQTGTTAQSGGVVKRNSKKPPPVIVDGTLSDGNIAIQPLKGVLKDKSIQKRKTSFYYTKPINPIMKMTRRNSKSVTNCKTISVPYIHYYLVQKN